MCSTNELADTTRVWLLAGVYGNVPSFAACIDDVGAVNEAAGVLARARQPCMPYASGELLHSLGTEVQPESRRANRRNRRRGAAVAPQGSLTEAIRRQSSRPPQPPMMRMSRRVMTMECRFA